MSRKVATIRKWYGTWGIAHSFVSPSIPPNKFFIHINNLNSPDTVLGLGVEISFVEGEPRTTKELPAALEIETVLVAPVKPVVKTAEVNPSSEVKQ
jgi:hypothetical protein